MKKERITYQKSYSNPFQLVELMQLRGLHVDDVHQAADLITKIGYFRLSSYFHPLLAIPKEDQKFKSGATFDNLMEMYWFDRKLRLFIFGEIEKIEIALRSILIDAFTQYFGDQFWMTTPKYFSNYDLFIKTKKELLSSIYRSKEDYIVHFKDHYRDEFPPSWMLAEIISIGCVGKVYKNISDTRIKKQVARKFGLQPIVLESWIMTIAGLRNICCHHSRLWNRELPIQPAIPRRCHFPWLNDGFDSKRTYFRLCMIKYLLYAIAPKNKLTEEVSMLLIRFPSIDKQALGFQENWLEQPLWRY